MVIVPGGKRHNFTHSDVSSGLAAARGGPATGSDSAGRRLRLNSAQAHATIQKEPLALGR